MRVFHNLLQSVYNIHVHFAQFHNHGTSQLHTSAQLLHYLQTSEPLAGTCTSDLLLILCLAELNEERVRKGVVKTEKERKIENSAPPVVSWILHAQFVTVVQVIAILVLWQERRDGVRSSGVFFILWLCLVTYAALKMRSLILLAEDKVFLDSCLYV